MLKRTNVQEVLNKNRGKHISGDHLMAQVQRIFDETASQRSRISTTLSNGGSAARNSFQLDLLESNKIYHLDDIRQTCINYRLRFLDSKYFKGEIPEEAVSIIRKLEKDHETEINGLKILAPSKLFKLEDKDDPLLFAPIGNDYFYLI